MRRSRCAGLGIGLLVAGLGGLAMPDAARAEIRPLRVVSYNVWGLPSPFTMKPSRLRDIARVLPGLEADIVGLVETFTAKARILAKLPQYPFRAWGRPKDGTHFSDGLLLISKWPILQTATVTYSRCNGTDCFSRKGALYARVRVDGIGELDVFVTHANASARNEEIRVSQMQELGEFVAEHSGGRPLLMLGDFNFNPDSPAYRELQYFTVARDSHREYAEAHPELSEQERDGFTWDPPRNSNIKDSRPRERLDYIWVRDLARQRVETTRTRVILDEPVSGRNLSDHFGLLADLVVETKN